MTIRLMHQRFCPQITPLYSAIEESGAYPVQPAAACPPGTKNPAIMIIVPSILDQKESIFRTGKAISLVPIISGMRKLPNAPTNKGTTTKKTMMVACIVNSELKNAGSITPLGMLVSNHVSLSSSNRSSHFRSAAVATSPSS